MQILLVIISLIVFSFFLLFILKKNNSKNNKITPKVKPKVKEFDVASNILEIEHKIAKNLMFPVDKKDIIYNFIDILIECSKQMEKQFGFNTSISFELKNLIEEHLPTRIDTFVMLNEEHRKDREDDFIKDILSMQEIVKKTLDILNTNNLNKDERESLLIKIKY